MLHKFRWRAIFLENILAQILGGQPPTIDESLVDNTRGVVGGPGPEATLITAESAARISAGLEAPFRSINGRITIDRVFGDDWCVSVAILMP